MSTSFLALFKFVFLYKMAPNSTNQLKFPWEDLKAETLRAVARDLGFRRTAQSRQTLMTFLESVEVNGCTFEDPHTIILN